MSTLHNILEKKICIYTFSEYHFLFFKVASAPSSSSVYQNDEERFGTKYAHSGIVTGNHFQSGVEKSPWLKVMKLMWNTVDIDN